MQWDRAEKNGSQAARQKSGRELEEISKNLFLKEFENSINNEYQDRPLPIPKERGVSNTDYFSFEKSNTRVQESQSSESMKLLLKIILRIAIKKKKKN